ncbi:MAG: hypothetical protein IT385_06615 [Deltaproteobacteria bacterium]|nr:hypothetical protein [Deltaproteobacteria bacterium]
MRVVHIERKALPEDVVMDTARRALATRLGQWLTPADLAVATGLPLADAEAALLHLSTRHPSRLGVEDDGTIVVRFLDLSETRPAPTAWTRARAWLARHRDPLLAAFTVLLVPFVCIMGMAGSYGLVAGMELQKEVPSAIATTVMVLAGLAALLWVFVSVGIAASVAVIAAVPAFVVLPFYHGLRPLFEPPRDPDFSVASHVGSVLLAGTMMWIMAYHLGRYVRGLVKRVFAGESARWAPRLWRSAGGLVFGPARPEIDPLEDERRLVERIRELEGIVTTADLMGLFGWTPARADSEIVRVMMDYGGDVRVSDDGAILWVFPTLGARDLPAAIEELPGPLPTAAGPSATPSTSPTTPTSAPVFRAELGPAPRFFGCGRGFLFWALFILVPSALGPMVHPELVALPSFSEMFVHEPAGDRPSDPLMQSFGSWPALLVALAWLARLPSHLIRRARWRRWRAELEVIAAACDRPDGAPLALTPHARRLVAELRGEVALEARGQPGFAGPPGEGHPPIVKFPDFERAFTAARRARAYQPSA